MRPFGPRKISKFLSVIAIYICPLIYTPLPNSRWLHHAALRCVPTAQRGAYTWQKGQNSVKTRPKWAQNTCLCTPNGRGSLLEKHIFDPFFTYFCSQKGPFSRHIGIFHGPKPVPIGSKCAKTTCFSVQNGQRSLLEKHVFDPFLTHFWSQNDMTKRQHFQGILGFSTCQNAAPRAHNGLKTLV